MDNKTKEFQGWTEAELRSVIQCAGIELLPDGGHKFRPKAVKLYCEEHTAQRITALESQLSTVSAERDRYKEALEHYANKKNWATHHTATYYQLERDGYVVIRDGENHGYDTARSALAVREGEK